MITPTACKKNTDCTWLRQVSICLGVALLLPSISARSSWYGPEPFRRERIEGRDFDYGTEGFLDRFSYNPLPVLQPALRAPRDGVIGVGGSTKSNELYVREQVQLSLPTDNSLYAGYRFLRFEDFDGHYDEQLLGIGTHDSTWSLVFWGDVEGAKSETDMQLELQLHDQENNQLRLILAAPDAIFNKKTDSSDEYLDQPYTGYMAGQWALTPRQTLYGFLNWNNPTRFFSDEIDALVEDRQLSAGVGTLLTQQHWILGLEMEGLHGERERNGISATDPVNQNLHRRFHQLTLEARTRRDWQHQSWFGVRHLAFDEDDEQPYNAEKWQHLQRQETYLYAGHQWPMSDSVTFAPTLIAGYAEIDELHPLQPEKNESESTVLAKLVPSFVFALRKDNSATITASPTLYLHRAAFGGGMVQLEIPL